MSEIKREMNLNPWEQSFCWFWYNDDEVFQYTQEDFDARVKELADSGITIILTFSLTHFRLSYYPYWEDLNECLRKIVVACHKYGIRVVEHHSAHLTHWLLGERGWEHLERNFFTYSRGHAKYDNWKKIFPFLTSDYQINGVDIRTFAQIDGRTGTPVTNPYGAYSMCFNNPDYRRTYFEYLKGVVATGIDGIMNDDIQYFGDEQSCACEHCRRLFKEETGYDLPNPDGWDKFYRNFDDPAYIAWKKFKFQSTGRMYRDLTAFYEKLGVKLLRPNYCSDILKHCPTCYSFDRCIDLWDFIFQENCFSAVMKQSYLDFMTEAIHRYAAGERYGIPSMSMFYPDRPDSTYFGWALARSWGQLYTGTCEGMDVTSLERPYRMFEKKYIRYYAAPRKIADVSFYFSRRTRDFTEDARYRYMQKMMGGMQAAYEVQLGLDMVMEDDSVEELLKHGTIVTSYVAMLGDEELRKLSEYVRRGGRLIILGDFAIFNEDGSHRELSRTEELLGVRLAVNTPVVFGKGEIRRLNFEPDEPEFQPTVWVDRRVPDPKPVPAVLSKYALRKRGTGRMLAEIVGTPRIAIDCENEYLAVTAYEVEGALAVHLVNLADTVAETAEPVAHTDLLTHFTADAEKLPAIRVTVNCPLTVSPTRVIVRTPEREDEVVLPIERKNGALTVEIPAGIFSGYALVAFEA